MRAIIVMAATIGLAACTGGAAVNTSDPGNSSADLTPEGPSVTAQLFGGGKPLPLSVQRPLANGAIIYLTSIQAKATETVVGIRVINGYSGEIQLNWIQQKTFLVAGGQKYFLSPPVENKEVKIGGGAKMQGELVFLGTLPKSGQVTLVINDGLSDTNGSTPGVSIPIPVTEAAWSDDGSKKNLAAWRSRVTSPARG